MVPSPGVGIPDELVYEASPIINKALETGARGRTIVETDYTPLANAFMQKAQLDLGIANLKADMGMRMAEGMANLELNKAELAQDMIKFRMDHDLKLKDLRMQIAENEVGFFEGLANVVGGVAAGVSIAATAGASAPLVLGAAGAAGGLITAGAGAQGGRRGMTGAREALGGAANFAAQARGMVQANKLSDLAGAAGTISDLLKNPQTRQSGLGKLDQLMAGIQSAGNELGMNPEQIRQMQDQTANMVIEGGGGLDAIPAFKKTVDFMSLPKEQQTPQAKQQLIDELNGMQPAYYSRTKQVLPQNFRTEQFRRYAPELLKMDPTSQGVAAGAAGATPTPAAPGAPAGGARPAAPRTKAQSAKPAARGSSSGLVIEEIDPKTGRTIRQVDPNQGAPSGTSGDLAMAGTTISRPPGSSGGASGSWAPEGEGGVNEQDLLKQGGETVEQLDKVEGVWDRIKHGGTLPLIGETPGLLTDRGVRQDRKEEEAKKEQEAIQNLEEEAPGAGQVRQEVQQAGTTELAKKNAQYKKTLDEGLAKLEASNYEGEGSEDLAANAENADAAISQVEKQLKNMPQGTFKGLAAQAREKGVDPAQLLAAYVGYRMGGKQGAALGAMVGKDALGEGFNVKTDFGMLSDKEKAAIDEIAALKEAIVPAFVRTNDPGSAVREFEAKGYDNLLPSPFRTPEENRRRLVSLRGILAQQVTSRAKISQKKFATSQKDKNLDRASKSLQMQSDQLNIIRKGQEIEQHEAEQVLTPGHFRIN